MGSHQYQGLRWLSPLLYTQTLNSVSSSSVSINTTLHTNTKACRILQSLSINTILQTQHYTTLHYNTHKHYTFSNPSTVSLSRSMGSRYTKHDNESEKARSLAKRGRTESRQAVRETCKAPQLVGLMTAPSADVPPKPRLAEEWQPRKELSTAGAKR